MTKKTIPVKIEMVLNVTSTVGDSIGADIKQVMEQYVIDGLSDDNEITNVTLAVTLLVRRSLLRHLQQTKDITLEVQGSVQYDSTSTEDATAISEELKILLNAENLNQALLNSGVNGVLGVKQATTLVDACPLDPDKTEPGICGCGVADDTAGSALRTCGTTLFPRGSCVVCCDAATNAAGPACCDKVPYDPDASTCCNDTWLFQGDTSADCASASWEPSQVPSSQPSSVSSSNPSSQLSSEPSSQPSSVYGEDVYLIKSLYNGKCVDWDYGDNNNVHAFPCHSESNQFWYMTGDEELKSPFGSECLDYDYG